MKSRFKQGFIYGFFLVAGVLMLLLGIVTPYYFRGIAPVLIQRAGEPTLQVAQIARELIDYGRISPVFEFIHEVEGLREDDRLYELAQRNPEYFFTGGSAPYVEEIARRLNLDASDYLSPTTVVELLTPSEHRAYVMDFLSRSRNSNVQQILANRDLKGTVLFSPVSSSAGAPLEVAIVTTALLIQAEDLPRPFAAELARMAHAAQSGETSALEQMESVYLAILTLGKRFPWVSLSELTRKIGSTKTLLEVAALFRQFPDERSLLFTILLLHDSPSAVFAFIEKYGREALSDIRESVAFGQGSVDLLLQRMSPIYRPNAWNQQLDGLQQLVLSTPFYRMAIRQPVLTGVIKLLFLFSSGLCFIILLRLILHQTRSNYRSWLAAFLANVGNIAIAVAFAVSAWLVLEPEFLKQANAAPTPSLAIHFATANPFDNLKSEVMNNMHIDQVTLLILGLFFTLQVAIYAYCRVRLQEIKRLETSAATKLKLIENEENLFDSGLYVGLGGTVASLIMLALNIVEASLMAAYASTLFGIIFVAILKIFSVRTYRNRLILSQEPSPAEKAAALESDLAVPNS